MKDHLIFKEKQINYLLNDLKVLNIYSQLKTPKVKISIDHLTNHILQEICSEIPTAFWERKQHNVPLPYEPSFSKKDIYTEAMPAQMNSMLLEYCKNEISSLLDKKNLLEKVILLGTVLFFV